MWNTDDFGIKKEKPLFRYEKDRKIWGTGAEAPFYLISVLLYG